MICSYLSKSSQHLQRHHIREIYALPKNHGKICAKYAVKPFLRRHLKDGKFVYERELEEVDGFARDLLDVFSEALAPGNVFVGGVARTPTTDDRDVFVKHPILENCTFRPWKKS